MSLNSRQPWVSFYILITDSGTCTCRWK